MAVDGQPLPRPARKDDRIAIELLAGGHCLHLVAPHPWSFFDRDERKGEARPPEDPYVVWFDAKPGGRYVVEDSVMTAQMLDVLDILVAEIHSDGARSAVSTSMAVVPAGVTCRAH